MLKTVRAATFVIVIFACFCATALITMGVKDRSDTISFLQSPGVFERFGDMVTSGSQESNAASPLVVQAHLFALRINPPIQKGIKVAKEKPTERKEVKPDQNGEGSKTVIITPPEPQPPRFDLLATVLYESSPEKSLALFQSGSKQQWFRCGETVDRYWIREIKNGCVLISQPEGQLQKMRVPSKNSIASLLKGG